MTVQEQLAEARAELELELTRAELDTFRRQKQLSEAGEQWASPGGRLFDDPWHSSDPRIFLGHMSSLDDRLEGKNAPIFETETELAQIRGDCRLLSDENEVAVGVKRVLANFTQGTGFLYSFASKDKESSQTALIESVQEWLDEFLERVQWQMIEREIFDRGVTDGEPFVQLNHVGGGKVEPLLVEPDAIAEPKHRTDMSEYVGHWSLDWKFGIGTEPGRPHRPLAYFVDLSGDQRDWEVVPEHRMVHGKRNVVRNVKRGLSDFYPVISELRRADKILRNTGEGAALQSAIAWIREHPAGTTASQVLSLGRGKTEIEVDRPTLDGSQRSHRFQRYLPGTILDVRAGQIYKAGPMGDGNTFIDVSQAILRYVAVRWNMPEYLISADASNSNFASTLVVESPFVKAIQWEQQWFMALCREVVWKVLGMAIRAQRFARYGISTVSEMKKAVVLNIQEPRVSVRNQLEETKINQVLHLSGLLSKETWSAKEDLDFTHEQAKLKENPPSPVGTLGDAGLELGLKNKQYQPQANEPGNKGDMPELGQKQRT